MIPVELVPTLPGGDTRAAAARHERKGVKDRTATLTSIVGRLNPRQLDPVKMLREAASFVPQMCPAVAVFSEPQRNGMERGGSRTQQNRSHSG